MYVNDLDFDKLKNVPVGLSKLSNAVKNDAVKKTVYAELVNVIRTNDTSELVRKTDYNTEIEDIEKKIPNHDKCITTNEFKLTFFEEIFKQGKLAANEDLNTIKQRAIKNVIWLFSW